MGLIQVSVRQKRSGLWASMRSDKAAGWRGRRIERMLKVLYTQEAQLSHGPCNALCHVEVLSTAAHSEFNSFHIQIQI